MIKILNVLGNQDEEDLSFISSPEAKDYVCNRQIDEGKIQFPIEFGMSDKQIGIILQQLLEFNPFFRRQAKEILKNPIFDKIRDPVLEKRASGKIKLKVDQEGAFDYQTPSNESRFYYIYDIRQMVEEEVHKLRTLSYDCNLAK